MLKGLTVNSGCSMVFWNHCDLTAPPVSLCSYDEEERSRLGSYRVEKLEKAIKEALKYHELKSLSDEYFVFSRLLYKNKNQQRHSKFFQVMKRVQQCLNRLFKLDVAKILKDFLESFSSSEGFPILKTKLYLPSRQMLEYVLVRLMGAAKLLLQTAKFCMETYAYMLANLSQLGHLIANCMVYMATLSRIWILCKHELHQVILWYVELQPWQSTLKGTQVDWLPPNTVLPCDLVDWLGAEDDEYRSLYDTRLERLSDTDINIEEYMKMLGMSMHSGDDLNMSMPISNTPTSKSSTSAALGVTEEEEEAENRGDISAIVPAINEEDIGEAVSMADLDLNRSTLALFNKLSSQDDDDSDYIPSSTLVTPEISGHDDALNPLPQQDVLNDIQFKTPTTKKPKNKKKRKGESDSVPAKKMKLVGDKLSSPKSKSRKKGKAVEGVPSSSPQENTPSQESGAGTSISGPENMKQIDVGAKHEGKETINPAKAKKDDLSTVWSIKKIKLKAKCAKNNRSLAKCLLQLKKQGGVHKKDLKSYRHILKQLTTGCEGDLVKDKLIRKKCENLIMKAESGVSPEQKSVAVNPKTPSSSAGESQSGLDESTEAAPCTESTSHNKDTKQGKGNKKGKKKKKIQSSEWRSQLSQSGVEQQEEAQSKADQKGPVPKVKNEKSNEIKRGKKKVTMVPVAGSPSKMILEKNLAQSMKNSFTSIESKQSIGKKKKKKRPKKMKK